MLLRHVLKNSVWSEFKGNFWGSTRQEQMANKALIGIMGLGFFASGVIMGHGVKALEQKALDKNINPPGTSESHDPYLNVP